MTATFKAFQVSESNGEFSGSWQHLQIQDLPQNDLLVSVEYSSINYKDMLSASGNRGVTRTYPHVPGIDAAGTVIQSNSADFPVNTKVLVTGFDLGMNTWGGFGEIISMPAAWALKMPAGADSKMAMSLGTAGLTAALSVDRILRSGIAPDAGPIAVSGATGGVGSIAVAILAKLGFAVTAISGKHDPNFLIETLGASRIIDRLEFVSNYDNKPMSKPEFAAAIDTVGGEIVSGLLKATQYGGVVTCCGMVNSPDLHTSIFPFILRGVELAGIDSVQVPMSRRTAIWNRLLTEWYPDHLEALVTEIGPGQLPEMLKRIADGQAKGRYILKHDKREI